MRPRDHDSSADILSNLRRRLTGRARALSALDAEEAVGVVLLRASVNPKVAAALAGVLDGSLAGATEPEWLIFWLFRTLQYVVMEQRREQKVLVSIDGDDHYDQTGRLFATDAGPEEELSRRQYQEALRHCLKCLHNQEQERAVVLSFCGFKQREIAEKLGIKVSTTGSLIKRGKDKLYNCLQQRLLARRVSDTSEDPDV